MQLFSELKEFQKARQLLPQNVSVGLVPTMGALHDGHASLVEKSVAQNDRTVVTIFVNPTQFGPNEDFSAYPRDLEKDSQLLESLGVDAILAPTIDAVYPEKTFLEFMIKDIGDKLCASSRPGHMEGVLQIVSILFHATQANRAYFGLKDYQQFILIKRLVHELHFNIEIVPCPIVRETDGLAMSSRNAYLSPEERKVAPVLYGTMKEVKEHLSDFATVDMALAFAREKLSSFPEVSLDYVQILNGNDLSNVHSLSKESSPHMFIAAYLGKSRLIDNLPLTA